MVAARCADCGAEFVGHPPTTITARPADLCPTCQRRDDREYANTLTLAADMDGRFYSRRAMQERLSVSGDSDE